MIGGLACEGNVEEAVCLSWDQLSLTPQPIGHQTPCGRTVEKMYSGVKRRISQEGVDPVLRIRLSHYCVSIHVADDGHIDGEGWGSWQRFCMEPGVSFSV